jgi:hypothetical protein
LYNMLLKRLISNWIYYKLKTKTCNIKHKSTLLYSKMSYIKHWFP